MSHRYITCLLLPTLIACMLSVPVDGDVFQVNKQEDDNGLCTPEDCALREAVLAANARLGSDIIEVPPGTYQLNPDFITPPPYTLNGELIVTDDVEIISPGAVIAGSGSGDGRGAAAIFLIRGETAYEAINVRLEGLTITGGRYCCGAALAIPLANVILDRCWITRNEGTLDAPIVFAGRLEIINSTISDNTSQRLGGAIDQEGITTSTLIVRNSTISGNTATFGGAIYRTGGGGEIRIENSTIVNNSAIGSIIYELIGGTQKTIANNILSGDCRIFQVTSEGGNIITPDSFCRLYDPADVVVDQADLGLLPLGNYGGPTPVHALEPTSPAIDLALDPACPATDQRGEPRPIDGDGDGLSRCDAGAVEFLGRGPLEVPVLSGWALFVLAGWMAIAGLAAVRKRG